MAKIGLLITDGSSDLILMFILRWLFAQHAATFDQEIQLRQLAQHGGRTLRQRIAFALAYGGNFDAIFVHRDAEAQPPDMRRQEIEAAVYQYQAIRRVTVAIIPVQMTETWLLFDEDAIRYAAGNPNGQHPLHLPSMRTIETLPDTKSVLKTALLTAANLNSRRQAQFQRNIHARIHDVAKAIDDFAPLRQISAFQQLESDIAALLRQWQSGG